MKGNVVVMEFWAHHDQSPALPRRGHENLAASDKDKARMVGIACRSDEKTAPTGGTSPAPATAGAKGDSIASDYKVAGHPSYYVIGPNRQGRGLLPGLSRLRTSSPPPSTRLASSLHGILPTCLG